MLGMISRQHHLKHRVRPPCQGRETRDDAGAVVLIHAVELAHRSFGKRLAGVERSFQHALAMRRHQQVRLRAARYLERFAEQRTGNREFIVAEAEVEACRHQHRRVIADAHRDIEFFAARMRRPAPAPQGGDWARCRQRPCYQSSGINRAIDRLVWPLTRSLAIIAPAVIYGPASFRRETRNRQFVGQRGLGDDRLLAGCRRYDAMRQRILDRGNQ